MQTLPVAKRIECERLSILSKLGVLESPKLKNFSFPLRSGQVEPLRLPARSPNLNEYAERFVRTIRQDCLRRMFLVENSLRGACAFKHIFPKKEANCFKSYVRGKFCDWKFEFDGANII
jgi:hypothetical protein